MNDPEAIVVPLGEAAAMLGIVRDTAYRLVARDEFPVRTVKVGGKIMVSRRRLEEYVDGPDGEAA